MSITAALRVRVWLSDMTDDVWQKGLLEKHLRECCENEGFDFKHVCQTLRVCQTGSLASPPIFEIIEILGRAETLGRLDDNLPPEDRKRVTVPGEWARPGWRPGEGA